MFAVKLLCVWPWIELQCVDKHEQLEVELILLHILLMLVSMESRDT